MQLCDSVGSLDPFWRGWFVTSALLVILSSVETESQSWMKEDGREQPCPYPYPTERPRWPWRARAMALHHPRSREGGSAGGPSTWPPRVCYTWWLCDPLTM